MAAHHADDFTFMTGDTSVQLNPDGTCVKHPYCKLRETTEDGYTYQKDTCPECEAELETKLNQMKQKRYELDRQLEDLEDEDEVVHQESSGGGAWNANTKPAAAAAGNSNTSGMFPTSQQTTVPTSNTKQITLESLSQQVNQMQQMQDWLLQQKEQEMASLKLKVEQQQEELVKKEVEMALLKEKLSQQEQRMQHELKLIKMAAYKRRHNTSSSSHHRRHSSSSSNNQDEHVEQQEQPNVAAATAVESAAAAGAAMAASTPHDEYVVIDHSSSPQQQKNKDHSSEESFEEVVAATTTPALQRKATPMVSNNVAAKTTTTTAPPPLPAAIVEEDESEGGPELVPPTSLPRPPSARLQQQDADSDQDSEEARDAFDVNMPKRRGMIQASNEDAFLRNVDDLGGNVPVNIDTSVNPIGLEEQVTMDTVLHPTVGGDSSRLEHAQAHSQEEDDNDAFTMGQTVASSTYGEDRHKVVNQAVLDPYGDSGVYTGVVLLTTGMPHGLGRMLYDDDGRTYEGDWRHGRWHGFGKATFANGDSYEGEYRFDQRHGRGLYKWSDGRQYDGDFYEDKRHGRGTFKWPDGAVYEGDFLSGQREGHGRYSFADGGQYVGDWVDGRYEGYGECEWADGRSYKGEWKQGMAHGRGVETFADGTVRHDGLWENDDPIFAQGGE